MTAIGSEALIKPTKTGNPTETRPISSNESSKEMRSATPVNAATAPMTRSSAGSCPPAAPFVCTEPGHMMFWKKLINLTHITVSGVVSKRSAAAEKHVTRPTTKKNSYHATGSGCGENQ